MKTMTKPSKKIHDFNEDKIIGDEGESIVKRYLESLGSVKKVVDMANNKIFFHKDVDFVLERHDATKFRIEVKTDQYKSGNIYYETISNTVFDTEGCMEKSRCDYLCYYFINFDKLYILRMKDYKELMDRLIKENHPALSKKSVKNKKTTAKAKIDYIASSVGYTLPLCVLEELMPPKAIKIIEHVQERIGE